MNKKMTIVAFTAAFIGMGIAMPQCPGEKALQTQVDGLQANQMEMTRKLSTLDGQLRGASSDLGQTRQVIGQLTAAVTAQKEALDRMDAVIKDLQARSSHGKTPTKSKKKGR